MSEQATRTGQALASSTSRLLAQYRERKSAEFPQSIESPMSEFATDLLSTVSQLARKQPLPRIQRLELPTPPGNNGAKKNNFAALVLDDGSVGMTYVALDQALDGLQQNRLADSIAGNDPLEIAKLYLADAGWQRALGLSAINAISQHVLLANNVLKPMTETLPVLLSTDGADDSHGLNSDDHFGMVGYFGRLVDPLTAMGARITVIELDAQLVRTDGNLEVTLDTSKLENCNKVIITGTTLLNHTIDNILQHCNNAEQILMLGPTASCVPQPLFDRGVTLVGGFHVTDDVAFVDSWRAGKKWRQCGFRYSISQKGKRAD